MNDGEHGHALGLCAQCRQPAAHVFTEDGLWGVATLAFCCQCYSLLLTGTYKPGRCGEQLTLAEMGFTKGADGVWRNFPQPAES
jgi:hypothetical protein